MYVPDSAWKFVVSGGHHRRPTVTPPQEKSFSCQRVRRHSSNRGRIRACGAESSLHMAWGVIHPVHVAARTRGDREAGDRGAAVPGRKPVGRGGPAAAGERRSSGGGRPAEGAAAAAEAEALRDGESEPAAAVFGQAKAQASARRQAGSPGDRRRARAGGIGADRVALQGISGHRRPGSAAGAAGDPLSPGALADAGRAHDHRAASGRDCWWLWPGAAPVRPGRPRPGPGHQRAADRPARGYRHRHLQAAGGAAADQSARRFRDRGLGGAARGSGERAPFPGSPSTTPAPATPGATASPPRSATAGSLPSAPACRSHARTSSTACGPATRTTWSTRRRWPTGAGTIWPGR